MVGSRQLHACSRYVSWGNKVAKHDMPGLLTHVAEDLETHGLSDHPPAPLQISISQIHVTACSLRRGNSAIANEFGTVEEKFHAYSNGMSGCVNGCKKAVQSSKQ